MEAEHAVPEADAIAKLVRDEASYRAVEFARRKDAIAFVKTLATERATRTDLPDSLPQAIRVLCEERLMELRQAASRVFEDWREKYLAGHELIQNAEHSGQHILETLTRERERGTHRHRWTNVVSSFFPGRPAWRRD